MALFFSRSWLRSTKFFTFFTASLLFLTACSQAPSGIEHQEAVKARLNLALAYLEEHNYPKAKENIDRAIAHHPEDYLPYSVLGYYFQQTAAFPQAENAYQKALKLSRQKADVRNNYGTFLCQIKRFNEAYAQFQQAAESEDYYFQADAWENLARCANAEPNAEKQWQALQQLEKLDKAKAVELRQAFGH